MIMIVVVIIMMLTVVVYGSIMNDVSTINNINGINGINSINSINSINNSIIRLSGGYGGGSITTNNDSDDSENSDDTTLIITGSPSSLIDGIYMKKDLINGRLHYEKRVSNDPRGNKLHLYWSGSQWQLHYDLPSIDQSFDKLIGYTKMKGKGTNPTSTSSWYIKTGKEFEAVPRLSLSNKKTVTTDDESSPSTSLSSSSEFLGVPTRLLPLYFSFLLDSIATGIAMPILPFYVMSLGMSPSLSSLLFYHYHYYFRCQRVSIITSHQF